MTFWRGGLFSSYFLTEGAPGLADYHAIDDATVDALGATLAQRIAALMAMRAPNEAQTESDLIAPVLDALGWRDLYAVQAKVQRARTDVPDYLLFASAGEKVAAGALANVSEGFKRGVAIVEAKRWGLALDRGAGALGDGVPSSQILRYLNNVEVASNRRIRFGILTNGRLWRLYDQQAASKAEDYLELDLLALLEGIVPGAKPDLLAPGAAARAHGLRLFLLMFGRDAFVPDASGQGFHARALGENRRFETQVTDDLSRRVFDDVFPGLAAALHAGDPQAPALLDTGYLADLREATLTYLYRLLFVLYAEDRDLLPTRAPGYEEYSLDHLRTAIAARIDEGGERLSATRRDYDENLRGLWRQIDKGDGAVGVPPYNGGLFAPERSTLLERARVSDAVLAPLIDALSRLAVTDRGQRVHKRINYRDLSVRHLGSVYERLLEFDLAADEGAIVTRPSPFARKTSGSYYTPDGLVRLIVRRTLGPLIQERRDTFAKQCETLRSDRRGKAERLDDLARVDAATAMLTLKVCDPAMGSGHFLVSAVDHLADAVLAAMATAGDAVDWTDAAQPYASPLAARIEAIRARIRANADAKGWRIGEGQLDDRHLVRRMILKRCIYGVDKNPMAVELAKLSLWLHSFTVGAPLSFLDHHLRCGDSLFGEWARPAIERLEGGGLFRSDIVTRAEAAVKGMTLVEEITDSDIAEVEASEAAFAGVEEATAEARRVFDLLQGYRWVEASAEDALREAKRASKEADRLALKDPAASRAHSERSAALRRRGTALDVLLRGEFGRDPAAAIDIFYGRVGDLDPAIDQLAQAVAVASLAGFFHWEVGFPGVWTNWLSRANRKGGFDAVIGNPPWDRLKMQEVEWFAARAPAIARAVRASDRKKGVKALQDAGDPLADDYARASTMAARAARMAGLAADKSGQYPLLGGGDVNLYSLFVERAGALAKPGGLVGLIVPSGIAADFGAAEFFRSITTRGTADEPRNARLCSLLDFENRGGNPHFFPDVDSRFKFSALVFGGADRTFAAAECGFFLGSPEDEALAERTFALAPSDFTAVNPNTNTAPIFRTPRDAELTLAIYARVPVLVDGRNKAAAPKKAWPVRYVRMFDMTNDSGLFRTTAELERLGAYPVEGGRWGKGKLQEWVPLYEGKMVQAFDHRAASVVVNTANLKRPAQPEPASLKQHKNPDWLPAPQFFVSVHDLTRQQQQEWSLVFKSITAPTNVRTMIAGLIPLAGVGNSMAIIEAKPDDAVLLAANLNSFALDYVLRQKVQGQNLNWFMIEQLPILPPAAYARVLAPGVTVADLVRREVLRLTYPAHDMAPFARDLSYVDADGEVPQPFAWDEADRRHRRARLDALYFLLHGLTREDAAYILSTFPIVEREDIAAHGRFLTRDLILAYMNALEAGDVDRVVVLA